MDDIDSVIYDENDIEDFEDYRIYHGIDDYDYDDFGYEYNLNTNNDDDDDGIETDIKELYF